MSEEEKEAIQNFEFFLDDISKNGGCTIDINFQHKKEYESMWKIFRLIKTKQEELEKKDRQLEERTNRINKLEKECQKYFDNMMDTINDNSKKDKIIKELKEHIDELSQTNYSF